MPTGAAYVPYGAGAAWRSSSGCSVKYLTTTCRISPPVTPAPCVVAALAVSGVMDRAVSATKPASRAATDFERIFSGNVIAVLYIVSSLRRLQWLLRQTKYWNDLEMRHEGNPLVTLQQVPATYTLQPSWRVAP